MNEIQAGRVQLLAPIAFQEFDLSIARDKVRLPWTGNTFYADPGSDTSPYRGAAATLWVDQTPITIGPGFLLRKQTSDVMLSNVAQSGKALRVLFGQDIDISNWFTNSAVSFNTPAALIAASSNTYWNSQTTSIGTIAQLAPNDSAKLYVIQGSAFSRMYMKWTPAEWDTGSGDWPIPGNSNNPFPTNGQTWPIRWTWSDDLGSLLMHWSDPAQENYVASGGNLYLVGNHRTRMPPVLFVSAPAGGRTRIFSAAPPNRPLTSSAYTPWPIQQISCSYQFV